MTARIVVTTALALMMLTSSAWAECGWVLWGQVRSTSSWEVIQSFKSKDACEGDLPPENWSTGDESAFG